MSKQTINTTDVINAGRVKINSMFTELYAGLASNPIVLFTSLSGAVDDADISLGSVSFGTDSIAALQAMLDMASTAGEAVIFWDGHYSVSGALSVYSNTRIIGFPGCGVILRDHSNSQVFKNANQKIVSEAIVDENITIENLIINGNGYNTGATGSDVFDVANNGHATNGSAQTKRNPILEFYGVRNLKIKDVQLLGGRYWASTASNVDGALYENVFIDFGASSTRDDFNYDGLHFKGGTYNLRIINPILKNCKDDNIALNAHAQLAIYTDYIGPIDGVYIENVYMDARAMGIGIYSETAASAIDNIFIRGVYGETNSHCVRITNGEADPADGDGVMGLISIEDVHVDVLDGSALQDFDALIHIRGTIDKLILKNLSRSDYTKAASYVKLSGGADAVIKELIIDGVTLETTGGTWANAFLEVSTGTINACIITNYIHRELTSGINSPMVLVNGGTIGRLVIGERALANINALVTVSSGTLSIIEPFHLGSIAFASLPSAALYDGSTVYVNNEADGPTLAFSNGTNWIDVRDGNAVTGP